jgi:3-oxoadipate enol-lactonase
VSGAPVVLLHAGVCDRRMWDGVVPALHTAGRTVVAPDLRGFGSRPPGAGPFSHARDVLALLDGLGAGRADLVGASFGGRVALEVGVLAPQRVASLALLAPAIDDWEWSDPELIAYGEAEEAALARGDLDAAVRLNVRMWARSLPPPAQDYVAEAQRRAFELGGDAEEPLDPPLHERLSEVAAETLVMVGDGDVPDFVAIARHLAATLPGPGLRVVEGAGHLLALERPGEVAEALAGWLSPRGGA